MKNSQLFPFERNRYYAGKMLTSADFEAEQLYMNNKRRFLNHALFGSGVVCGLNVVELDDSSILIESGVALDDAGREIVVGSSVVKKLSGLAGYDMITSDQVKLYLQYKEEEAHPVYCGDLGTNGKEYENNRIDEGYEFFLMDAKESSSIQEYSADEGIIFREKLLDHEDYTVFLCMPYTVSKGRSVKIIIQVIKNSDEDRELFLHARLQLPLFDNEEGKHELDIKLENLQLVQGETFQKEYWVFCEHTDAEETNIIARKEEIQIQVGGCDIEPRGNLQMKVALTKQSANWLAARETGKETLEQNQAKRTEYGVCIAWIQLLRTGTNSLIAQVKDDEVKRYILTPGKTTQRMQFMSYFRRREQHNPTLRYEEPAQEGSTAQMPMLMTSGRVEIPLDVNMKKGEVCYSGEIMHGLGKGNVYVAVGTEFLYDEPFGKDNRRNTIYGNPQLFDFAECMSVETAVRVLNDKGSFQIAAKLLGEQKSIVMQFNWVAVKFGSAKDAEDLQDEEGKALIPETPTVRLKARESYYFNVKFQNMKPCQLSYELTESGSGEIGADGLYTAPAKEGVYEIYIYCTDMPKISTYVYAIVKK